MQELKLKVKIRDKKGKGYARKLRREGILPAVLYGHHLKEGIPLEVELREMRRFLSLHPEAREKVFILELAGQKKNGQREVVIKNVQHEPVRRDPQHVDFYEISRGEKMTTFVPLSFEGEARGAKKGGVVEYLRREVEIECLPREIPAAIKVDITPLDIGDHLSVNDLKVSSKIKILTHPEDRVVSVLTPARVEEIEEEVKVAPEEVEVVGRKREEEVEEASGEETSEKEKVAER